MTFNVPAGAGRAWLGWPFAAGERGFLGSVRGPSTSGAPIGSLLAALAALGFVSAILSLLALWLPHGWWPALAAASATESLVVMALFYRPNKLAAIAVDLAVLAAAIASWTAATSF